MKTIIRKLAAALSLSALAICGLLALQQHAHAQYYPGDLQPGQVLGNNGSSAAPAAPMSLFGAVAPVGSLPLYAAPTATGSGNCLSSGNACTLATACSFVTQIATFLGQASPINLANGTYTNPGCNVQGEAGGSSSQLTSLIGNCSSPSSVIIALSGGAVGITGQDHATIGVNCVEFTSSGTGGIGIFCRQLAVCDYSNVIWGTWGTGGAHISVNEASSNLLGASGGCETISANFNIHWNLSAGGQLTAGCATSIPSAVSWLANGNGFINAINSYVDLSSWSLTGSGVAGSTGVQAVLSGPGYLLTAAAAACSSVLPGNANTCSFAIGFQDNAGEGITGSGILVGQSQPTIDGPIAKAHIYAGLPGSPTAGQIVHIIDGSASNCSDSACSPGATVTGGGGSIDLSLYYTGAAWKVLGTGAAQLPPPGSSRLGGIESIGAIAHQWVDSISTSGVPHQSQPATADLSDVTAPIAWTASDGSGAGLTFATNADTRYVKSGKFCIISFMIQWPTTSDAHIAQINGIPATCTALSGSFNWVAGGTVSLEAGTISSELGRAAMQPGGTSLFLFGNGNQMTNANMSNGIVRGTITYITN